MKSNTKYVFGVDPIDPNNSNIGAIVLFKMERGTANVVKIHFFTGKHPLIEKLRYRFLIWKYSNFFGKGLFEERQVKKQ